MRYTLEHHKNGEKKMSEMKYRVLLYYKFTSIKDPVQYADEHKAFCRELKRI